jgi:hypothetical protein
MMKQSESGLRGTLSRFKVPVRVWWLGDVERGCPVEWPKTANGKLRKKDIREIGVSKRAGPFNSLAYYNCGLKSLTSRLQG